MEASAGGLGSVSWVTGWPASFWASLPFPVAFSGVFGKFSFLGAAAVFGAPPASRRPIPAARRPATAAPPPSKRKPPRPTAVPPSGPASRDLTAGEGGPPRAPAGRGSPPRFRVGAETGGTQEYLGDGRAGEQGHDDGYDGRKGLHERVGERGGDGEGA